MERSKTPWRIALRQLKKNRLAMSGFWLLAILYIVMFFSGFLAPYDQTFADRDKNFYPPVAVHWSAKGPYIYNYVESPKFSRHYLPDTRKKYPIHFFVNGRLMGVDPPARLFLFGSDDSGRDVFSRILYGSRIALSIGIVGVIISYGLGVLIGGISGFYAGKPLPLGLWWEIMMGLFGALLGTSGEIKSGHFSAGALEGAGIGIAAALLLRIVIKRIDIDNWIQRGGEALMMFPSLYLLLALRALIPDKLSSTKVYFLIVVILSFIRWPAIARIVRGLILSIREREFVTAAEAVGASNLRIIVRHILPNTLSQIIVLITLSIPSFILGEAFLSYLDLGIREPQASWGNMLTQAQDVVALMHYPWILLPGVFIFITVLGFNLLGDGLRDALDPKMRT